MCLGCGERTHRGPRSIQSGVSAGRESLCVRRKQSPDDAIRHGPLRGAPSRRMSACSLSRDVHSHRRKGDQSKARREDTGPTSLLAFLRWQQGLRRTVRTALCVRWCVLVLRLRHSISRLGLHSGRIGVCGCGLERHCEVILRRRERVVDYAGRDLLEFRLGSYVRRCSGKPFPQHDQMLHGASLRPLVRLRIEPHPPRSLMNEIAGRNVGLSLDGLKHAAATGLRHGAGVGLELFVLFSESLHLLRSESAGSARIDPLSRCSERLVFWLSLEHVSRRLRGQPVFPQFLSVDR